MPEPVYVPESAREPLAILVRKAHEATTAAEQATREAELFLAGICVGLGVDRMKVKGYNDETGELMMDEPVDGD